MIDNYALFPDHLHAILLPQHRSQQASDHFPMPHGTIMEQYSHDASSIGARKIVGTIPLDSKYNTLHFYLASGSAECCLFCEQFKKYDHQFTGQNLTFESVVLDSKLEEDESHDDDSLLLPSSANRSIQKIVNHCQPFPRNCQSLMT